MGRGKEPELTISNPLEAKKYRDEAAGHLKVGNYDRGLSSLNKVGLLKWIRVHNSLIDSNSALD